MLFFSLLKTHFWSPFEIFLLKNWNDCLQCAAFDDCPKHVNIRHMYVFHFHSTVWQCNAGLTQELRCWSFIYNPQLKAVLNPPLNYKCEMFLYPMLKIGDRNGNNLMLSTVCLLQFGLDSLVVQGHRSACSFLVWGVRAARVWMSSWLFELHMRWMSAHSAHKHTKPMWMGFGYVKIGLTMN